MYLATMILFILHIGLYGRVCYKVVFSTKPIEAIALTPTINST